MRHRAIDTASVADYSFSISSAPADTRWSSDHGEKPHRVRQVVGLLAAGTHPPSPRHVRGAITVPLRVAGEMGMIARDQRFLGTEVFSSAGGLQSLVTEVLPSAGGHQVRRDLGFPHLLETDDPW